MLAGTQTDLTKFGDLLRTPRNVLDQTMSLVDIQLNRKLFDQGANK